MTNFHDLFNRNCNLNYIRGILELINLYFWGQEYQFGIKKAHLKGLLAKFAYLRPDMHPGLADDPFS